MSLPKRVIKRRESSEKENRSGGNSDQQLGKLGLAGEGLQFVANNLLDLLAQVFRREVHPFDIPLVKNKDLLSLCLISGNGEILQTGHSPGVVRKGFQHIGARVGPNQAWDRRVQTNAIGNQRIPDQQFKFAMSVGKKRRMMQKKFNFLSKQMMNKNKIQ